MILNEWLVEVLKLRQETLYLCIQVIDQKTRTCSTTTNVQRLLNVFRYFPWQTTLAKLG